MFLEYLCAKHLIMLSVGIQRGISDGWYLPDTCSLKKKKKEKEEEEVEDREKQFGMSKLSTYHDATAF